MSLDLRHISPNLGRVRAPLYTCISALPTPTLQSCVRHSFALSSSRSLPYNNMAFIPALPVFQIAQPSATSRTTITMSRAPVSRRAALRLAAFSIVAAATSALADSEIELEQLKEDVEELNYDEEVLDVGPDAKEKIITRIKKKPVTPEFRTQEAQLIKEEDKRYEEMLAKEREEEARIKAEFSKK